MSQLSVLKLVLVSAVVAGFLLGLGCASEVTTEVTREVPVTRVVTPTPLPATPPSPSPTPPSPVPTPLPATPTPQPQDRVFQVGLISDITTSNPWAFVSNPDIWTAYVLEDAQPTLFKYSDIRFDWVPSLADGFSTPIAEETIAGETFWTTEVELKKEVKWSDGVSVTASDFVFTTQTTVDLQLSGQWASFVNPEFFDHAEALDTHRIKIFFKQKPGLAVWQFGLAFLPIMSESYWLSVVTEAKEQGNISAQQETLFAHVPDNAPSAGGFVLKKWEKGAFVEKVKNPNYYFSGATITQYANGAYSESKPGSYDFVAYGEPGGDKSLEYTIGPDAGSSIYSIYGSPDAAVLALKKGEIDFMLSPTGLPRGLQDQLEGQPGLATISNPSNNLRYMGFNLRRSPLDSKEFRQAVATLIDKEFLSGTVLQGAAIPVYSMVPAGNAFWHNQDVPKFGQGLDRGQRIASALELLASVGFTWEEEPQVSADGRFVEVKGKALTMPDGEPVRQFEILAPSAGYDPLRSTFALWVERWLNDFGIPARVNFTSFNAIVAKVAGEQDFDMFILGWSLSLYPNYLEAFFHSRNSSPGNLNVGGYFNSDFDELAEELLAETDLEEARKNVFMMQEFLAEELPFVPLYNSPIIETYRSDRLQFPFTQALGGLQNIDGSPAEVLAVILD